jgi:hypothetical protein
MRRRSRSRRSTLPTSACSQTPCCQVRASLAQYSRGRVLVGVRKTNCSRPCFVRRTRLAHRPAGQQLQAPTQPASGRRAAPRGSCPCAGCWLGGLLQSWRRSGWPASLRGVLTREPAAVVAPEWLACFPARERAALFDAFFARAPAPALLRALAACAPAAPPPASRRPPAAACSRRDGRATDCCTGSLVSMHLVK